MITPSISWFVILVVAILSCSSPANEGFESLTTAFEKKKVEQAANYEQGRLKLTIQFEKRLNQLIAKFTAEGATDKATLAAQLKADPSADLNLDSPALTTLREARTIYSEWLSELVREKRSRAVELDAAYVSKLKDLLAKQTTEEQAAKIRQTLRQITKTPQEQFLSKGGSNSPQILNALGWLVENQNPDGSWGTSFPAAMTGFALLSFAGHRETFESPRYGDAIRKGANFLVQLGNRSRNFLGQPGAHIPYEHAIATYALAETYRLQDPCPAAKAISDSLHKNIRIILDGQTKAGGWMYTYGKRGRGDLSVSGWNIQALKSADFLYEKERTQALRKAGEYLRTSEAKDGLYRYRITDLHKNGKLSLTGVGLLCSKLTGSPPENSDASYQAILSSKAISYPKVNLYSLYYDSQACFLEGGDTWEKIRAHKLALILDTQNTDGSWTGAVGGTTSARADAKIYQTCLCTLILETSYRAGQW